MRRVLVNKKWKVPQKVYRHIYGKGEKGSVRDYQIATKVEMLANPFGAKSNSIQDIARVV